MTRPRTHPYPDKIRLSVAETIAKQVLVMREWSDLTSQTRDAFLSDSDQVLNTLWDASRVETKDQLEHLPGNAVIANQDGNTSSMNDFLGIQEVGLPVHVIYWGDSDE